MTDWRALADQGRWHEISLVEVMGDDLDVLIARLQTVVPVRKFGDGAETFEARELARHASSPEAKAAAGLLAAAEEMRRWWQGPADEASADRTDDVRLAYSVLVSLGVEPIGRG